MPGQARFDAKWHASVWFCSCLLQAYARTRPIRLHVLRWHSSLLPIVGEAAFTRGQSLMKPTGSHIVGAWRSTPLPLLSAFNPYLKWNLKADEGSLGTHDNHRRGQEDRKTRDWLHGIPYLRKDDSAFLRFLQLRFRLSALLGHSSSHLLRLADQQTKRNRTKTKIISVPCIFSTESATQEEERIVIKPLLQTQSFRLPLHRAFLPPKSLWSWPFSTQLLRTPRCC